MPRLDREPVRRNVDALIAASHEYPWGNPAKVKAVIVTVYDDASKYVYVYPHLRFEPTDVAERSAEQARLT